MCGACGRRVAEDPWSGAVASRRARWEVARLVDAALARGRSPARVSAAPAGWAVRSGTGRTALADTLTALWQAVGPLPPEALPPVDGPGSTVAAVVRAAYEHVRAGGAQG